MIIHILGFGVGGALYEAAWGVGLALLIITIPLPWIAVVLANDEGPLSPRRRRARRVVRPRTGPGTELPGPPR